MKRWPIFRFWLRLVILAMAGVTRLSMAQSRYLPLYQEPEWLRIRVTEVDAGFYAEGTHDETTFKNTSTSVTHDYLFAGPSLGLTANGSLYHPNLLRYYLNSEGALGYSYNKTSSGSASESRNELQYLGRFAGSADLLEGKPYHATVFANYDHTFRDNDFFTRITVDSLRYGARSSWQLGNWTFSADYMHRDETSTSPFPFIDVRSVTNIVNGTNVIVLQTNKTTLDQNSVLHEDTATFNVRNEHSSGGTTLNYNWNHYTRSDVGRLGEGDDQAISLADSERFGPSDRYKFNSSLSYLRRDTSEERSDEITGYANLSLEHRPTLQSFYDLNYDHFNSGSFTSDNYGGQATLQHQLYESLISSLTLRGSDYESSDDGSSGYIRRYGAGWSEAYNKRVGAEHRLRMSNSIFVEHTDQQNIGIVKNERHTFSEGGAPPDSFFLNVPNVIALTIVVTDDRNTQPPYLENFDYRVVMLGPRTLIERLTGSRIPVGASVLVDYQAQPTPPGGYETLTDIFQVRFELWKNFLGLYARVGLSKNNAARILRVQDITTYAVGADLTWRAFRAGAEYEVYDSTDSDYRSARLFQSYAIRPDDLSTLSLDLTEAWIDYITSHRQEQDYQFITRYHRSLSRHFGLDADAGVAIRRGGGVDQTLATFRPSLKYVIGKTTISAGFDYEYELFLSNEERQKQMFFLRYRRVF